MNKRRELFLLFDYVIGQIVPTGYIVIHKHTALNDEPPYKMCSFYGKSTVHTFNQSISIGNDEEWMKEEQYKFFLIRKDYCDKFITMMNSNESQFLEDFHQMEIERNYDPTAFSKGDIERICSQEKRQRSPKIKFMGEFNLTLSMM